MEGIILFVDNHIEPRIKPDGDLEDTVESRLFSELRKQYPVIGVNSLKKAEEVLGSIGSYSALILDWKFSDDALGSDEDLEGLDLPETVETNTKEFLLRNSFYSLVYIFSNEEVEEQHGEELKKRFPNRITFHKKSESTNPAEDIIRGISEWKDHNKNLTIPNFWLSTINKSSQTIFEELAEASPNFLREIHKTAENDGVSPELFVIEMFQSLLGESLVQSSELVDAINNFVAEAEGAVVEQPDEKSLGKLFQRLYYTPLKVDAPVMTGDVFQVAENEWGVLVSPECDIRYFLDRTTPHFELLVFKPRDFEQNIKRTSAKVDGEIAEEKYNRSLFDDWSNGSDLQKALLGNLRRSFTQTDSKLHVLPSFPFNTNINQSALISFMYGRRLYNHEELQGFGRPFKLNTPFIQQLRQRYMAHVGRVGVPGLPTSFTSLNLKPLID